MSLLFLHGLYNLKSLYIMSHNGGIVLCLTIRVSVPPSVSTISTLLHKQFFYDFFFFFL